MRVAVMLCCFNRKQITRRCLITLQKQLKGEANNIYDVYIYDDGSTDGTYEMIRELFPMYIVVKGNGNKYWCKSMHYLMKLATSRDYDFYLMINDDVIFAPNAIEIMFHAYRTAEVMCGIVGATQSLISGKTTYGGRNEKGELLRPNGKIQTCVEANWNCFLLGKEVIELVGIIDGKYQHAWGDFDYSYRMRKQGIPIFLAGEYIGICENNTEKGTFKDFSLRRRVRLKKLLSPKGMPIYSYFRYNIKVKGVKGFFVSIYGYASMVLYILLNKKNWE